MTYQAICVDPHMTGLIRGYEYTCIPDPADAGVVHLPGIEPTFCASRFRPLAGPQATTPAPTQAEAAVAPAEGLAGTLATRHGRYGSFAVNGQIAQDIKAVMRGAPKWGALSGAQQEALDMFASKISRILTGDPNYQDSWHDIAGYATRIEELLKEQV